ncbi:hypothetical protein BAUCODRAFT_578600 [Baudoinia panamericana UAMH 10762]|uniref:Uncharacterized protein n=1 Tax=Baudoinia panamericana (strain UAMH 10762) TaxID=717646 RepID=M2LK53_BAUPA|nr:uncharacterized protein BAUCODRAFT_578600 [Baudoinia panamericana UAMH 10762]EMC94622.1 hypothetical protein BAUCODRAFT_578600 [Baudoinia panamericana UAMH 10762]
MTESSKILVTARDVEQQIPAQQPRGLGTLSKETNAAPMEIAPAAPTPILVIRNGLLGDDGAFLEDEHENGLDLPDAPFPHWGFMATSLAYLGGVLTSIVLLGLLAPIRRLLTTLYGFRHVHVLSVHHSSKTRNRPAKHDIIGVFDSENAARVVITELMGQPEFEGRNVSIGFPVIGGDDVGVSIMDDWNGDAEDGGLVVLVQKMYVRGR